MSPLISLLCLWCRPLKQGVQIGLIIGFEFSFGSSDSGFFGMEWGKRKPYINLPMTVYKVGPNRSARLTQEQPVVPKPHFMGVLIPTFYTFFIMALSSTLFRANLWVWRIFQSNSTLQVAPLGTSPGGQAGFVTIYIIFAIILTFGLAALIGRKKIRPRLWIVMAIMLAFVTVSFAVVDFQNLSILEIFLLVGVLWVVYLLSIRGTLPKFASLPFITFMAVTVGTAIVISFPLLTVVLIPSLLAIWDLYAVFRGPMVKVAMGMPGKVQQTMMAQLGASKLGFGDLLVYSMLAALGASYGILTGVVMIGFMFVGVYITFLILRTGRFRALPGLPIPVVMGFLGLILTVYI